MVTVEKLESLCAYLTERVKPPDAPGPHCNATLKRTLEHLTTIGELHLLDAYRETGMATCDCQFLLMFPGIYLVDDEGCEGCGATVIIDLHQGEVTH